MRLRFLILSILLIAQCTFLSAQKNEKEEIDFNREKDEWYVQTGVSNVTFDLPSQDVILNTNIAYGINKRVRIGRRFYFKGSINEFRSIRSTSIDSSMQTIEKRARYLGLGLNIEYRLQITDELCAYTGLAALSQIGGFRLRNLSNANGEFGPSVLSFNLSPAIPLGIQLFLNDKSFVNIESYFVTNSISETDDSSKLRLLNITVGYGLLLSRGIFRSKNSTSKREDA